MNAIPHRVEVKPHPLVRMRFLDAGHILGSAILGLKVREVGRERRLVDGTRVAGRRAPRGRGL